MRRLNVCEHGTGRWVRARRWLSSGEELRSLRFEARTIVVVQRYLPLRRRGKVDWVVAP